MAILLQSVALLFSVLVTTWALPSPVELVPRACTTVNVNAISKLNKATPNVSQNDSLFKLHRNGGSNSNTIKSVVSFTGIPQGATGCLLQIDLPKLPTQSIPTPIASGSSQSDVWLIKNPPVSDPNDIGFIYKYTWNKPPVKDQFVSTTQFPTDSPSDPYKTYLWSGTCKSVLSFQFELSDWQQGAGDVNFYNFFGGKYTPIGFQLVHSC